MWTFPSCRLPARKWWAFHTFNAEAESEGVWAATLPCVCVFVQARALTLVRDVESERGRSLRLMFGGWEKVLLSFKSQLGFYSVITDASRKRHFNQLQKTKKKPHTPHSWLCHSSCHTLGMCLVSLMFFLFIFLPKASTSATREISGSGVVFLSFLLFSLKRLIKQFLQTLAPWYSCPVQHCLLPLSHSQMGLV